MVAITAYGGQVLDKIRKLVSYNPHRTHFKPNNERVWIEIVGATIRRIPSPEIAGLKPMDYMGTLDGMVDITLASLTDGRTDREIFYFWTASMTIARNGSTKLGRPPYYYANGIEFFKVHPADLAHHGIMYVPLALEVRIHQPNGSK